MALDRDYPSLPFLWDEKTQKNDSSWLESIIRNSAPFSEGWLKARIVQLAHPQPQARSSRYFQGDSPYRALSSEKAIIEAILAILPLDECISLRKTLTENYVIKSLNFWYNEDFSKTVNYNFEIYADRQYPNVFLVTSTATASLYNNRNIPPLQRFRPLFNVEEFAQIIVEKECQNFTLKTHGYSVYDNLYYHNFMKEADFFADNDLINNLNNLEETHFYLGYHWPSEKTFSAPSLWLDYRYNFGIFGKFIFVLGGFALFASILIYLFLKFLLSPLFLFGGNSVPVFHQILQGLNFYDTEGIALQWHWIFLTVFFFWLLLINIFRIIVYQRDRYRTIHYGAPDLAEFFWRLDVALEKEYAKVNPAKISDVNLSHPIIDVNLIGHSLGALVVVDSLRILSDRFGKDDYQKQDNSQIGDYLKLDKLILAAPDIPLEFLRSGRNNYVRSAILRCDKIYLMSSDRDTVLRYLSTLVNWFVEPSLEMSALRLGNVYLRPMKQSDGETKYLPFIRVMILSKAAAKPTSAYDLFEKFNYLDCSEMKGLNGVNLSLNPLTGVFIDIINAALYLGGIIDAHGAYFWTNTPSFKIVKFLISHNDLTEEMIAFKIKDLIGDSKIRFLPSQPFLRRKK
jgi:hypothetical protein